MSEMKRCPRCGTWKDESQYSRNKAKASGLQTECKACASILGRKRGKQEMPGPTISAGGLPCRPDRLYAGPTGHIIARRTVRGDNGPK